MGWESRVRRSKRERDTSPDCERCSPGRETEACGHGAVGPEPQRRLAAKSKMNEHSGTGVSSLISLFPPMHGGNDLKAPCKQGRDILHHHRYLISEGSLQHPFIMDALELHMA